MITSSRPGGPAPVAVLGLGNRLLSDEGAGVIAAGRLAALGLPRVDVLDGGTLGLALVPAIEGRRCLLILDAMAATSRRPGEVAVLAGDVLRHGWRRCLSAHQLGITDALAFASLAGNAPAEVAAVTVTPGSLGLGWDLTEPVQQALPAMVHAARTILRSWGVPGA